MFTTARRWLPLAATLGLLTAVLPARPAAAAVVRPIHFPVEGSVNYRDDFGEPRAGHTHQGNDLMGYKLQRLLAAHDAVVSYVKTDGAGADANGGNMLILRDSEGWQYWYIHVNNDTPGTDDGLNPAEWIFAPGIKTGTKVYAGEFIGYMGDSGNAESTAPHLHFELHSPDGIAISPYDSLQAASHEPAGPRWFLRNGNGTGPADVTYPYGTASDAPLPCDWDGDGDSTFGINRPGQFHLRNSNTPGAADVVVNYGDASDMPVCGDWDGDGTDTIGIYRQGVFYLRNTNTSGMADLVVGYGDPGDRPVIGDWDGDGADTIGIFRAGAYYLRNTLTTGVADVTFAYGDPPDRPFVGDWDGDGIDTIGIFRETAWFLRNTNTSGVADSTFGYGGVGDVPVIGDWDGDGDTTVGVFRPNP